MKIITRTLVILLALLLGITAFGPYQPKAAAAAGPDLTITNITLSPAEPALGDTVTVTVAVKNQGDSRADNSFVTCYIDNSVLDSKTTNIIEPGIVTTLTFTWEASSGAHTVKAVADANKAIIETDENNNTGTYSFTTLAADLLIQSITWSPANPSKGDSVTFSITIKNQGSCKSRFTNIDFLIDGSTRGLQDVPAIEPGATLLKTYTWAALSGPHTLKAVVDKINNTKEINEANNELTQSFNTLPPDLVVRTIAWNPQNPSKDETVTFSVNITNQGAGRAGATHLGYYIDDEFIAAISVPELNAGASCNVTFDWTATADAHNIRVAIDYYQLVNENIETNNELKVSLLTAPPDLVISSLTWLPADAAASDVVTLSATLLNQGSGAAAASRAILYIDGKNTGYLDFPAILAGATQSVPFTWNAESGLHPISIAVDFDDNIAEISEDNNHYSTTISIIPPDLTVTNISYMPEKPAIGDTVTFTVTVKNQGRGKAGNFNVAFYVDDSIESIDMVSVLEYGASVNVTCEWKISNGHHVFKVYADYNSSIREESEKNNTSTVDIAPNMADLAVTNVTWSPPDIIAGQETVFTINIENHGGLDAGASRMVYYVDNILAGYNDIEPIAAGKKVTQTFIWPAKEGAHTITIVADAKDQLTELDEANNTVSVNIPPSDLTVKDISYSPQDALTGDTVVISATVINERGSKTPEAGVVTLYVDGVSIAVVDLPPLEAGESFKSSFNWKAEPGAHVFKIYADANNKVIEIDETNNEAEAAFSTTTPDLSVDNISWLTDSHINSNEVNFTVTIKNSGACPSGAFTLSYTFDNGPTATQQMDSIPGNSTANITFASILSEGGHTINIKLDTKDEISELDETNNNHSLTFNTNAPDLVIRSITWSPITAKTGEALTISAKVENRGLTKAANARISLGIDGVDAGFFDIPEIDTDTTATANFTWTAREGDHEITILADAAQSITESNEANNARSRTLTIAKPEAPVKHTPVINTNATTGSSLLDSWWWLLLLGGALLGLGLLYTTIRNMKKR